MNHDLKPGFAIYFVSLTFAKEVHIGGFTRFHDVYVIARTVEEAEALATAKYAEHVEVTRASARLALNQVVATYTCLERSPGFAEGCFHEEYEPSQYTAEDARRLVDDVDNFVKGRRDSYPSPKALAERFRQVWASFGYWCPIGQQWQKVGLELLEKIGNRPHTLGERVPFDTLDELHGLNGMFNQTRGDVVNFAS